MKGTLRTKSARAPFPGARRFNPADFLRVADLLVKRSDEASLRSAISRAYYGVFLVARTLLGLSDKTAGVHAETQRQMAKLGHLTIAGGLQHLRKKRNLSDYETLTTVTPKDAETQVKAALSCYRALLSLQRTDKACMTPPPLKPGRPPKSTLHRNRSQRPSADPTR